MCLQVPLQKLCIGDGLTLCSFTGSASLPFPLNIGNNTEEGDYVYILYMNQ